jgi:large subunit ribosomal protein L15
MVVRRKRTRQKQLGERTHGHGDTKNWRGAGNRGGHGKAGSHKHKFSKYYVTFGIKVRLNAKTHKKALNLEQVMQELPKWKRAGKVVQEEGKWVIDGERLKIGKVLGSGSVSANLLFRNLSVTEKAREKIESAKSEVESEFERVEGEGEGEEGNANAKSEAE